MAKKRLSDLSKELDISIGELKDLAKSKLADDMINGPGGWVTEEGQKLLHAASFVPELVPKHYSGTVLSAANNKRFVFVKANGIEGKIPVLIPKRLQGKFNKGKLIYIEEIVDEKGSSYRYVNGR